MPTYGYECKSCKYNFDVFQSIKDEPVKICPRCGMEVKRLINGGTGVIFKGGGFYVTDKGGKSTGKKGDASNEAPKTAKTEGSPCAGCPKAGGDAGPPCPKASGQ